MSATEVTLMRTSLAISLLATLLLLGCGTTAPVKKGPGPALSVSKTAPKPTPATPRPETKTTGQGGLESAAEGETKVKVLEGMVDDTREAPAEAPAEGAAGNQPPADKLFGDKVIAVFDFKDTPMPEVLKLFTALTNQNVVGSQAVMTLKITLYLKDVSPRVALSTMCRLYNLWFVEDENVIRIITAEEYGKELVVRRDEKTVVITLRYASVLGVADTVAKLMTDSVLYEQPEEFASYGHVGTETAGTSLSTSGLTSTRSRTAYYDVGTGVNVARAAAMPQGFEKGLTTTKIETIEKAKKAPGEEGEGAAAQAEAVKEVARERPVAYMAVFPRNNCLALRSVDGQLLRQISELVRDLDTVTTQVLLEVKILKINLTNDFSSLFDLSYKQGTVAGQPGVDRHDATAGGIGDPLTPTLAYTFIDQHVKARMQLLEGAGRVRKIATPLLLCANNAPGKFFVGQERLITIDWEQEVRDFEQGTARVTIRPVVQHREVGTTISITPCINEDGTVTMRLHNEISSVNKTGAAITFMNPQTNKPEELRIDTIDTANVDSIVVAKDAHTLALGGLISESDERAESKVPLLGDIPLLGFFFKRMVLTKVKEETVILITPHIMMSPAMGENVSASTVEGLSDHPFIKYNRPHVIEYDEKADKLRPSTGTRPKPQGE